MFESINEIAVIGCTLLMTALYILWYAAFSKKEKTQHTETTEIFLAGLSFLVVTFICALGISHLKEIGASPLIFAVVTAFFGAAVIVPSYLKSGMSIKTYVVHAGFIGAVCVADILILTYWPW